MDAQQMHKNFAKPLALFMRLVNFFGAKTLIVYGVIGAFSALINLLIFALLYDVFHIDYKFAVTISYFAAVLFNFISNRQITFNGSDQHVILHLCKYLIMIALNYLLTLFIVHFVVTKLSLTPYIGVIVSIIVTAFIGFTLSKFWIFKQEKVNIQ